MQRDRERSVRAAEQQARQFGLAVHAQLFVDIRELVAHGMRRYLEAARDLFALHAFGVALRHRALGWRERVDDGDAAGGAGDIAVFLFGADFDAAAAVDADGAAPADEAADEAAGDGDGTPRRGWWQRTFGA